MMENLKNVIIDWCIKAALWLIFIGLGVAALVITGLFWLLGNPAFILVWALLFFTSVLIVGQILSIRQVARLSAQPHPVATEATPPEADKVQEVIHLLKKTPVENLDAIPAFKKVATLAAHEPDPLTLEIEAAKLLKVGNAKAKRIVGHFLAVGVLERITKGNPGNILFPPTTCVRVSALGQQVLIRASAEQ